MPAYFPGAPAKMLLKLHSSMHSRAMAPFPVPVDPLSTVAALPDAPTSAPEAIDARLQNAWEQLAARQARAGRDRAQLITERAQRGWLPRPGLASCSGRQAIKQQPHSRCQGRLKAQ